MKFATVILFFSLTTLSAASLGQEFSLSERKAKLTDIFKKIEKQIPYHFVYDRADLDHITLNDVHLTDVKIHQGLGVLLNDQQLDFKIFDNYIVVKKGIIQANIRKDVQEIVHRGVVRDQSGKGIEGVSVHIVGMDVRTMTNAQGGFMLSGRSTNDKLEFTHIGYTKTRLESDGQKELQIVLDIDRQEIEDVVIVGYGTQKKVNLTGAISSISSKELENRPVRNVGAALQGQLPGVTIRSHTALPGQGAPSIRIRGINTLSGSDPMIVIDGIPNGNMNILNPDDIENITVLKDAASSSIYGVRGANGVILVTTKKGSSTNQQPSIGYSGYLGLQTPTALPKFVGSVDYMQLLNEARVNANQSPTYTLDQIEIARNGSDPNYFANTNWVDEIYKRNAPQQAHNININGSGNNINYYMSYGLLKEGGLITGDNYKANRHNVRMRLNTTIMDRLSIDANLGYIHRDYSGSSEGVAGGSGPISAALSINPLVPVRFTHGGWGYHGGQRNPIAVTTDGGTNIFGSQEVTANLQANLNIIDGLNLRGQYGLIYSNSKRDIFSKTVNYYSPIDNSLIYQTNPVNKFDARDYVSRSQTFLTLLEYEKTLNQVHYIKAMGAFSREEFINDNFQATRTNLPTQEGAGNLNLGTLNQLNSADANQTALQSFFGRVNYAFKDRYLAEFNFRHDASSKFIKELRWDTFWSGSAGWNFTEEPFMQFLKPIVDFGKVRVSYGEQGNDLVGGGSYPFRSIIGAVSTQPLGNELTIGYKQATVANRLLTWESTVKQNIGLDLEFLNRRLLLNADYYIHNTNNILLNIQMPDVLGVGTNYPPQNAGKVQNKGWELQVAWRDQIGAVKYSAKANLSDVRNKITYYGDMLPTLGDRIKQVGVPIDAFYGYVTDGLAQEADFDYNPTTGTFTPLFPYDPQYPMAPGDVKYKDTNNDNVINGDDRQVIGSDIPRYTYGFHGNFEFKGFDFSFFLQGVGKADGYLTGSARHALINDGTYPQQVHLDRWTIDNPNASYPRLAYGYSYNQRLSDFWLEDASYLRLKNIQLGYTFPTAWTQKVKAGRVRVYASADNLFTKSNFFYGYDPETPVSGGGFYPQVKTFVFGLNVNFK